MHRYRRDARTNLFDWSTGVDVTIPSLTAQTGWESWEFVFGVVLLDKCTDTHTQCPSAVLDEKVRENALRQW